VIVEAAKATKLTDKEQVEADGELGVLGDERGKRCSGGCLPNFVKRHEGNRIRSMQLSNNGEG
jgi:hypothetical protein